MRDQMTAPLKSIKGALAAAKDQTRALDTQVLALQKSQQAFASKGGKETVKVLGDQIKALKLQKAEWANVTKPYTEHVKNADKANKANKEQSGWLGAGKKLLGEFAPKLKETGGNMAEMGLAAGLASGGITIAVQAVEEMVGAIKELAVGLVEATMKLIEFTSKSAALREKMVANFTILRNNAKEGRATFDMLANIAARSHVSQENVLGYGKELLQAGIKPNLELQKSVQAITDLSKAGTEDQANKLKGIFTRASQTRIGAGGQDLAGTFSVSADELKEIGVSYDDYTKALSAHLGKTVTAQDIMWGRVRISASTGIAALQDAVSKGKIGQTAKGMFGGLDEVMERAKTSLTSLFMDVDTGPLMKALHELIDVFDPLTASGANAKSGITNTMNAIMKIAGKAVHEITLGFLKVENELLKLYLYSIPAINSFKKFSQVHDVIGKLKILLEGLVIIVAILAVTTFIAFLPLLLLIGAIIAVVIILAIWFGIIANAIADVIKKISDWGPKGLKAAQDLISGIVDGINGGVKSVIKAIEGLGTDAIKALKKVLGIASPSKEFHKLGGFAASGFSDGFNIEAGKGLKIASPGGISSGGGGGAKGNTTIMLGGVTIQIDGAKSPAETGHFLENQLADIFENALLERGE